MGFIDVDMKILLNGSHWRGCGARDTKDDIALATCHLHSIDS
jgi:hypothetical protein